MTWGAKRVATWNTTTTSGAYRLQAKVEVPLETLAAAPPVFGWSTPGAGGPSIAGTSACRPMGGPGSAPDVGVRNPLGC
jgi:hypothetical protein